VYSGLKKSFLTLDPTRSENNLTEYLLQGFAFGVQGVENVCLSVFVDCIFLVGSLTGDLFVSTECKQFGYFLNKL
jgi:hypothetical protein